MTSRSLQGKVAIVTASTEGIGYAIARRLGLDGAKVVISSRKQANVDRTVANLKSEGCDVIGLVCHVGKADHRAKLIEKTVATYGGIDILVSNAAANPYFGPILQCPEESWDKIFDTNLKATFLLVKEVVPHIEKRGGGSIILVASIGGYHPGEVLGPYSVSKTAMLGLTKALCGQCAKMNITVNGIAPGIIKTKFAAALTDNPEIAEGQIAQLPMGRFGEPDDCAGIVSFLASDQARYITGENIVIAGGAQSRL